MNDVRPFNNTIAPLHNVQLCMQAVSDAIERDPMLPGMVCFTGPSGFGKTISATYTANKYDAFYIECKSTWTKKAVLTAILREMSVPPLGTLPEMTEQIAEQLVITDKPLIVDEMDHLADKKSVEIIRDIYDASQAPILLIGEERLPQKLRKWERVHGRIMSWVQAQPASYQDAEYLAKIYSPDTKLAENLLTKLVDMSQGSIRRVCVNLNRINNVAKVEGWDRVDMKLWGNRELFKGEPQKRRIFK
ncbi:MAG: ATP-binding protein [Kangiella sp.]|nr:ATP-binding protein [Kangiella sp.]MCW9029227.1 ATP-binding protein [Kangiella sp.]